MGKNPLGHGQEPAGSQARTRWVTGKNPLGYGQNPPGRGQGRNAFRAEAIAAAGKTHTWRSTGTHRERITTEHLARCGVVAVHRTR